MAEEREITIYATRGGNMKKVMTNVTTWGELKEIVRQQGFDVNNLLAAENVTKGDLVNPAAILPTQSFRLFLRPAQTKSGSRDRKECFDIIRNHVANNPLDKELFIIDGKNMTQLTTVVLNELIDKYLSNTTEVAEVMEAEVQVQVEEEVQVEETKEEEVSKEEPQQEVEAIQATPSIVTEFSKEVFLKEVIKKLDEEFNDFENYSKAKKQLKKLLKEETATEEESEEESLRREAKEFSGY